MRRTWLLVAAVLFGVFATSLFAQEGSNSKLRQGTIARTRADAQLSAEKFVATLHPVAPSEWTEEKINAIPKRELTVVESAEYRKLSGGGLAKPNQNARFIACWHVEIHSVDDETRSLPRGLATIPEESDIHQLSLRAGNNQTFLEDGPFTQSKQRVSQLPVMDRLNMLVKQAPENSLAADEIAFLTNSADVQCYSILGPLQDNPSQTNNKVLKYQMCIFAESAEKAKFYAESILKVADYGYTRPIQLALLQSRQNQEKLLREAIQNAPGRLATLQAQNAEIKRTEGTVIENKAGLELLKAQIEVDTAGTESRIAACQKRMANIATDSDRFKQLDSAKLASEIELEGLQARLAKTNQQLEAIEARVVALNQYSVGQNDFQNFRRSIERAILTTDIIDKELLRYAPLRVSDNKITIQPLALNP